MKFEVETVYSSYYPLRRIQEDEEMLTREFERITKSYAGSQDGTDIDHALQVVKSRLDQLQEVRELILSIGVNEC